MTDIDAILIRRVQIEAERARLNEEDDRLHGDLRRWGTKRAMAAMTEAGFVTGESIVVERRVIKGAEHTYRMGILLAVGVEWGPRAPGDTWTMVVRTRSVLSSGRPGRALDYRCFTVADPASLPEHLKVTGSVNREKALDHPGIVRMSSLLRRAGIIKSTT